MEGKTIATIIGLVLLVLVGFWIFNNNDLDLAGNNDTNATTTENQDLTGTGGPEEGFDPLEDVDDDLYLNSDGVENAGSDSDSTPDKG